MIDGCLNDSVGDSIAEKNKFYCELTGQYWIWKNDHESDIVGLCHYRRYFWLNEIKKRFCRKNFTSLTADVERFLVTDNVESYLQSCDIILPKPYIFYDDNIKSQLVNTHGQEGFDLMIDSIKKFFPEYFPTTEKVFNRRFLYVGNLLITHKKIFDEYSQWLFTILQDVESKIDLNDKKNLRLLGFLSERLLNLYVAHNKMQVKEVPQIFIVKDDVDEENLYINLRYIKRRYFGKFYDMKDKILGK